MISLDELRALDDCPREKVPVPEWNTELFVCRMPTERRDRCDRMIWRLSEEKRDRMWRAIWIAHAACDEQGKPLWEDPAEAIEVLMGKSGIVCARIMDAISRLNLPTAAEVEEQAKNS